MLEISNRIRRSVASPLLVLGTMAMAGVGGPSSASVIKLTGDDLTPQQLVEIARLDPKVRIEVDDNAWKQVERSHQILIKAAERCQAIYGLTTGVGANKDQGIGANKDQKEMKCWPNPAAKKRLKDAEKRSTAFNKGLLHAHAAGVGPDLPPELVRAIMIVRLNTILDGGTGMRLKVAKQYLEFLNRGITPVVPSRGSIGEAGITLLSHIGLAMIGEWEVIYGGSRMKADVALKKAGLESVDFVGKDALASFSSNAYSAALAAYAYVDLRHLADLSQLVFALSLEGLNGNVAPFLNEVNYDREDSKVDHASFNLRSILQGSYLWRPWPPGTSRSPSCPKPIPPNEPPCVRPLQDPLSFRTAAYGIGSMERALEELGSLVKNQLNRSDDNPRVVFSSDDNPHVVFSKLSEETRKLSAIIKPVAYTASDGKKVVKVVGAVIPSANFSPLPYVISVQRAAIAVGHVTISSAQRTLRLSDPQFTGLARFLAAKDENNKEKNMHAFGAIQKPVVALVAENKALAKSVSLDSAPVAQDVEDVATNAPFAAARLQRMIDNLRYVLGLELIHAAQAADLRKNDYPSIKLSKATANLLHQFRSKAVSFLGADDHILTTDIERAYAFLKGCRLPVREDGKGHREIDFSKLDCPNVRR